MPRTVFVSVCSLFTLSIVLLFPSTISAQTSCLMYPSNSVPPSGYGTSWDIFDASHKLLIKGNCTLLPDGRLPVTIGSGDGAQLVYKIMYSYKGPVVRWKSHPLVGTVSSGDWLTGSGVAYGPGEGLDIVGGTTANPFYFVGYVCTNNLGVWKCGCSDTSCTTGKWQLQGYIGNGAGSTTGGGTTGGTGGTDPVCRGTNCYPWTPEQRPGGQDTVPAPLDTVPVSDSNGLSNALSSADPGDMIILSDGLYSGDFTISRSGNALHPIVVTAQNTLGARFAGKFVVSGNYVILKGISVQGGTISLNAQYSRVTRNKVTDATSRSSIGVGRNSRYSRVDHNEIGNYHLQGISMDTDPGVGPRYTWIDHNYIHDKVGTSGGNVEECIQLGQTYTDSAQNLYTVVEQNLVTNNPATDDCVSIKSSGNIIRGNTVIGTHHGGIVLRNGSNNLVISNFLRDHGEDINGQGASQRVIGNDAGKIVVLAREGVPGDVSQTPEPSINWLIAGNKASLTLGKGNGPTVQNPRVEAHQGSITEQKVSGVIRSDTTSETWIPAVQLQPNQVGPFSI